MSKWRQPGQPYTITVDGVTLTCKPLARGDALALAQLSQTVPSEDGNVEALYDKLAEQIIKVEGFEESPSEVLDYQTHEIMLEVFKGIIGASGLSDNESKNSQPLSDGAETEPARDVKNVESTNAGTETT